MRPRPSFSSIPGPPPDRLLPFAVKHSITLKGHPLLWHAYNPAWLPTDADELRELYRKRFREISHRYAEKIPIWDVVNESLVCTTDYRSTARRESMSAGRSRKWRRCSRRKPSS